MHKKRGRGKSPETPNAQDRLLNTLVELSFGAAVLNETTDPIADTLFTTFVVLRYGRKVLFAKKTALPFGLAVWRFENFILFAASVDCKAQSQRAEDCRVCGRFGNCSARER